MNSKSIIILGGYGSTGRLIAQLLLQETTTTLVLAGRNRDKAQAEAKRLNELYPGGRVQGAFADAAEPESLRTLFAEAGLVVVASSTAEYTAQVAGAALAAGIDYLDVLYSTQKMAVLQDMAADIEAAGCCFITDGGFHPGLPAVLIRYVAGEFDRLSSALVGSVIKVDWSALDLVPETMAEFVAEFLDFQGLVYKDGVWRKAGTMAMINPQKMDFGEPFGRQYGLPMFLEEMRAIPELYPEIKETAFFVGSLNWFVDWFLSPLIMVGLKISPEKSARPLGRLMYWGLRTFSRPPYGTLLKVEARGEKAGHALAIDLVVAHEDGYAFTAIPVAACLLQLLDGSIRKPGLWLQANAVEPKRLIADMIRLGVEVRSGTI
jgi:NAD(P)-dependent dehydrogenase (short-subunit alcohol dehydrogenase family)